MSTSARRILSAFLFTALFTLTVGLPPALHAAALTWTKDLSPGELMYPTGAIEVSTKDGYIFGGTGGDYLGQIIRTDLSGNVLWATTLQNSGYFSGLVPTNDGGCFVGTMESPPTGSMNVARINAAGTITWQYRYVLTALAGVQHMAAAGTGVIVIGGASNCVLRLDGNGAVSWATTLTLPASSDLRTVAATPDGGFILQGRTYYNAVRGALVIKLNSSGVVQWAKSYCGSVELSAYSLAVGGNGTIYVGGSTFKNAQEDLWLMKLTSTGSISQQKGYSIGATPEYGYSVFATSDGGAAVGSSAVKVNDYPWLLKLDSRGALSWTALYNGGLNPGRGLSVLATADGGYLLGTSKFGSIGAIKTDSLGVTACAKTAPRVSSYNSSATARTASVTGAAAGVTVTAFDLAPVGIYPVTGPLCQ